jgi:hypothetical protein
MSETRKPDESTQFASDLRSMRHRAINLGLHATGKQLEVAIRVLGLETVGATDAFSKNEAHQPQTVLFAAGPELDCRETTPCPDCGSTVTEMRTYGGSWDDADVHCAQCGKLIHRAWSPTKTG